jgi:hypothetical protein
MMVFLVGGHIFHGLEGSYILNHSHFSIVDFTIIDIS